MRRWMVITASLAIGLTSAAAAWADTSRPTPQLLVFGEPAADAPRILRGAPAGSQAVAAAEVAAGTEVVAGQRLWLLDRATGEVQSCTDHRTSTVGVREVRCTTGETGRYGRTFGRNYRP